MLPQEEEAAAEEDDGEGGGGGGFVPRTLTLDGDVVLRRPRKRRRDGEEARHSHWPKVRGTDGGRGGVDGA